MKKNIFFLSILLSLFGFGGAFSLSAVSCGEGYELRVVENIDFGTFNSRSERRNVNPETEGTITGVNYDSSGEVGNGSYAVVADPREGTSWAAQGLDHTHLTANYPSGTYGGMLFVNGANNPITLFTKDIVVCQNTDLEFEAWYANAHNNSGDNKPRLTFAIYDTSDLSTVIASYPSEPANASPSGVLDGRWARVALSFNSGNRTSLRLIIKNETGGTSGNDFVIDDIKLTVCVPIVVPQWGDNLSAGKNTIKVECDGNVRNIPITLSPEEAANAQSKGLTWFVWQYSDTKAGNDFTNWQNSGDIKEEQNGNYAIDVPKVAPNGQRAWRLVLAKDQSTAEGIVNGDLVATGCSFGTTTSPIIFECLPCQVPNVSVSTDKTIACIQDGVNEIITLTATVPPIEKEDNYVVDESTIDLVWLRDGVEVGRGNLNSKKHEISVPAETMGRHFYTVQAQKSATCFNEATPLSITINAPMIINLIAKDELDRLLPNNLTPMKREVRLEVVPVQGGIPTSFEWNIGDGTPMIHTNTNTLSIYPLKDGKYTVSATDDVCAATAEIEVKVKPLPDAFIPSNGADDINGVFPVQANSADQYEIQYKGLVIYNRYGQEVYNQSAEELYPEKPIRWDGTLQGGKLAEPGTYFYTITFWDDETLKGTIDIIKK